LKLTRCINSIILRQDQLQKNMFMLAKKQEQIAKTETRKQKATTK
jgi:hypothetical protein